MQSSARYFSLSWLLPVPQGGTPSEAETSRKTSQGGTPQGYAKGHCLDCQSRTIGIVFLDKQKHGDTAFSRNYTKEEERDTRLRL
jgi:hypothetical protein